MSLLNSDQEIDNIAATTSLVSDFAIEAVPAGTNPRAAVTTTTNKSSTFAPSIHLYVSKSETTIPASPSTFNNPCGLPDPSNLGLTQQQAQQTQNQALLFVPETPAHSLFERNSSTSLRCIPTTAQSQSPSQRTPNQSERDISLNLRTFAQTRNLVIRTDPSNKYTSTGSSSSSYAQECATSTITTAASTGLGATTTQGAPPAIDALFARQPPCQTQEQMIARMLRSYFPSIQEETVQTLVYEFKSESYERNEVIYNEGSQNRNAFFILLSGSVEIRKAHSSYSSTTAPIQSTNNQQLDQQQQLQQSTSSQLHKQSTLVIGGNSKENNNDSTSTSQYSKQQQNQQQQSASTSFTSQSQFASGAMTVSTCSSDSSAKKPSDYTPSSSGVPTIPAITVVSSKNGMKQLQHQQTLQSSQQQQQKRVRTFYTANEGYSSLMIYNGRQVIGAECIARINEYSAVSVSTETKILVLDRRRFDAFDHQFDFRGFFKKQAAVQLAYFAERSTQLQAFQTSKQIEMQEDEEKRKLFAMLTNNRRSFNVNLKHRMNELSDSNQFSTSQNSSSSQQCLPQSTSSAAAHAQYHNDISNSISSSKFISHDLYMPTREMTLGGNNQSLNSNTNNAETYQYPNVISQINATKNQLNLVESNGSLRLASNGFDFESDAEKVRRTQILISHKVSKALKTRASDMSAIISRSRVLSKDVSKSNSVNPSSPASPANRLSVASPTSDQNTIQNSNPHQSLFHSNTMQQQNNNNNTFSTTQSSCFAPASRMLKLRTQQTQQLQSLSNSQQNIRKSMTIMRNIQGNSGSSQFLNIAHNTSVERAIQDLEDQQGIDQIKSFEEYDEDKVKEGNNNQQEQQITLKANPKTLPLCNISTFNNDHLKVSSPSPAKKQMIIHSKYFCNAINTNNEHNNMPGGIQIQSPSNSSSSSQQAQQLLTHSKSLGRIPMTSALSPNNLPMNLHGNNNSNTNSNPSFRLSSRSQQRKSMNKGQMSYTATTPNYTNVPPFLVESNSNISNNTTHNNNINIANPSKNTYNNFIVTSPLERGGSSLARSLTRMKTARIPSIQASVSHTQLIGNRQHLNVNGIENQNSNEQLSSLSSFTLNQIPQEISAAGTTTTGQNTATIQIQSQLTHLPLSYYLKTQQEHNNSSLGCTPIGISALKPKDDPFSPVNNHLLPVFSRTNNNNNNNNATAIKYSTRDSLSFSKSMQNFIGQTPKSQHRQQRVITSFLKPESESNPTTSTNANAASFCIGSSTKIEPIHEKPTQNVIGLVSSSSTAGSTASTSRILAGKIRKRNMMTSNFTQRISSQDLSISNKLNNTTSKADSMMISPDIHNSKKRSSISRTTEFKVDSMQLLNHQQLVPSHQQNSVLMISPNKNSSLVLTSSMFFGSPKRATAQNNPFKSQNPFAKPILPQSQSSKQFQHL